MSADRSRHRTHLLLVRHGQTQWNLTGRLQGSLDAPLTPAGLDQARALACLLGPQVHAVRCSPAPRAARTAHVALAAAGRAVPIVVDDDLAEMDLGPWQGLTFPQVAERWPDHHAVFWQSPHDYRPPGAGESFHDLATRTRRALSAAAAAHPGRTVLVITHSLTIKAAAITAAGASIGTMWQTPEVASGTVTEIVHDDGAWSVARYATAIA